MSHRAAESTKQAEADGGNWAAGLESFSASRYYRSSSYGSQAVWWRHWQEGKCVWNTSCSPSISSSGWVSHTSTSRTVFRYWDWDEMSEMVWLDINTHTRIIHQEFSFRTLYLVIACCRYTSSHYRSSYCNYRKQFEADLFLPHARLFLCYTV